MKTGSEASVAWRCMAATLTSAPPTPVSQLSSSSNRSGPPFVLTISSALRKAKKPLSRQELDSPSTSSSTRHSAPSSVVAEETPTRRLVFLPRPTRKRPSCFRASALKCGRWSSFAVDVAAAKLVAAALDALPSDRCASEAPRRRFVSPTSGSSGRPIGS